MATSPSAWNTSASTRPNNNSYSSPAAAAARITTRANPARWNKEDIDTEEDMVTYLDDGDDSSSACGSGVEAEDFAPLSGRMEGVQLQGKDRDRGWERGIIGKDLGVKEQDRSVSTVVAVDKCAVNAEVGMGALSPTQKLRPKMTTRIDISPATLGGVYGHAIQVQMQANMQTPQSAPTNAASTYTVPASASSIYSPHSARPNPGITSPISAATITATSPPSAKTANACADLQDFRNENSKKQSRRSSRAKIYPQHIQLAESIETSAVGTVVIPTSPLANVGGMGRTANVTSGKVRGKTLPNLDATQNPSGDAAESNEEQPDEYEATSIRFNKPSKSMVFLEERIQSLRDLICSNEASEASVEQRKDMMHSLSRMEAMKKRRQSVIAKRERATSSKSINMLDSVLADQGIGDTLSTSEDEADDVTHEFDRFKASDTPKALKGLPTSPTMTTRGFMQSQNATNVPTSPSIVIKRVSIRSPSAMEVPVSPRVPMCVEHLVQFHPSLLNSNEE